MTFKECWIFNTDKERKDTARDKIVYSSIFFFLIRSWEIRLVTHYVSCRHSVERDATIRD